jgi:[acyl-carrier-protein] S-malonyltransferase
MIEEGVDLFYSIGPGPSLTGFMKRIDRSKKAVAISTVEDLEGVN